MGEEAGTSWHAEEMTHPSRGGHDERVIRLVRGNWAG